MITLSSATLSVLSKVSLEPASAPVSTASVTSLPTVPFLSESSLESEESDASASSALLTDVPASAEFTVSLSSAFASVLSFASAVSSLTLSTEVDAVSTVTSAIAEKASIADIAIVVSARAILFFIVYSPFVHNAD